MSIKETYNLREMVRGKVRFRFYRDRNLYYETDNGVVFPVPIDDVHTATFLAEDKAILFMRWMRRFLENVGEELLNSHLNK